MEKGRTKAAWQVAIALVLGLFLLCAVAPCAWAEDPLSVSANDDAAVIEGCSFGVDDFKRAQTGTSAPIDGSNYGYHFLAGSDDSVVSLISAKGFVIVHVPSKTADDLGIRLQDREDREALKRYLVSLDELNAHGGELVLEGDVWHFTSDSEFALEGVAFSFNRELKDGFFYDTIIGEDGSDAVDDGRIEVTHACFAHLAPANGIAIAQEPGFLESVGQFMGRLNLSPLWVTLKTTLTAIVIIFIFGLAAAYFSLRVSSRVQDIADSIFTIPMVLPPTVCGFLLLLLLGKRTFVGQWFDAIGFPLVFSWQATVIAAVVVAFPIMYRSARGAFEGIDRDMLDAARTLGWSNGKIFFKLMLPLSWSSIASGTVLAFARALGEFGATLFLAGNYLGITRTIPIAIYFEWMNGNTDIALFWTAVIMLFSFVVILLINLWSRRTMRYRKGGNPR